MEKKEHIRSTRNTSNHKREKSFFFILPADKPQNKQTIGAL